MMNENEEKLEKIFEKTYSEIKLLLRDNEPDDILLFIHPLLEDDFTYVWAKEYLKGVVVEEQSWWDKLLNRKPRIRVYKPSIDAINHLTDQMQLGSYVLVEGYEIFFKPRLGEIKAILKRIPCDKCNGTGKIER